MHIVPALAQLIKQQIVPQVPGKLKDQFLLGVNALSLQKFESLSSNARMYGERGLSRQANEMKMYRLLRNQKVLKIFYSLLSKLDILSPTSSLNMDFTTWDKFNVLTIGMQTKQGRALPVWQEIITYPLKSTKSQNLFILDSLHKFLLLSGLKRIGRLDLQLVADRGFTGETLVKGFEQLGLIFTIRFKGNIYLKNNCGLKQQKFCWSRKLDTTTDYHGCTYRVVRSSMSQMKKAHAYSPWHILTNDFSSPRQEIIKRYYHRFEIEEVFKDVKQLLTTKPRWFKKTLTLTILLWFQILGFWLIYLLAQKPNLILMPQQRHPKKKLSWFRLILESLWRELTRPIYQPVTTYRHKRGRRNV